MTENATAQPSSQLRALDRLVGTWQVSGGLTGTTTYEWQEGGFFLLQRTQFTHDGRPVIGVEVIGHERPFGEEPSEDIKSRFYDSEGNTLDYVYELEGDTLTIWGGVKGSPAYFRGTFSAAGNAMSGAWVYPDGGGYESSMSRVTDQ